MPGAKSPYADDQFHYRWNWHMDCYAVVETGLYCRTQYVPPEEGRQIIKELGMSADQSWSKEEQEAMLQTTDEMTVEFADNGKPIAVGVHHDDYGHAVYNHPAWAGIDWEQIEYVDDLHK